MCTVSLCRSAIEPRICQVGGCLWEIEDKPDLLYIFDLQQSHQAASGPLRARRESPSSSSSPSPWSHLLCIPAWRYWEGCNLRRKCKFLSAKSIWRPSAQNRCWEAEEPQRWRGRGREAASGVSCLCPREDRDRDRRGLEEHPYSWRTVCSCSPSAGPCCSAPGWPGPSGWCRPPLSCWSWQCRSCRATARSPRSWWRPRTSCRWSAAASRQTGGRWTSVRPSVEQTSVRKS